MSSLRATFTLSFAAVAAVVTVLVGFLSYDAAARLVRVDQQTVFSGVVQDLRVQVRETALDPGDFSSSDPDHDGPWTTSSGPPVRMCRCSGAVG